MGNGTHYEAGNVRLNKRQKNRIKPNPIGGSWYAQIDPDTGVIKWIRRKVKKKRK